MTTQTPNFRTYGNCHERNNDVKSNGFRENWRHTGSKSYHKPPDYHLEVGPGGWKKERKVNYTGRETLPMSIKEIRISRAEAPCIPFTKRHKRKKSMGIRRVTSRSPCLISVMTVVRSLLKSASGASEVMSELDKISMKLQLKLGDCKSVSSSRKCTQGCR
eukprot:1050319-Pelagomonas_calceolata.AAC.1